MKQSFATKRLGIEWKRNYNIFLYALLRFFQFQYYLTHWLPHIFLDGKWMKTKNCSWWFSQLIRIICLPVMNCHRGIFFPKGQFLPWLTLLSRNDRESVALDRFMLGVRTRPVVEMFCGAATDAFRGVVGEFERKCVWLTVKVGCTNVWLTVGML